MQTQPIATFALDEDQPRRPYVKRRTKRTPPAPAYTRSGSSSTHTTTANTPGPQGDSSSPLRALASAVSSPATQELTQSKSPQGPASETERSGPNPPTRQTNSSSNGMSSMFRNPHACSPCSLMPRLVRSTRRQCYRSTPYTRYVHPQQPFRCPIH